MKIFSQIKSFWRLFIPTAGIVVLSLFSAVIITTWLIRDIYISNLEQKLISADAFIRRRISDTIQTLQAQLTTIERGENLSIATLYAFDDLISDDSFLKREINTLRDTIGASAIIIQSTNSSKILHTATSQSIIGDSNSDELVRQIELGDDAPWRLINGRYSLVVRGSIINLNEVIGRIYILKDIDSKYLEDISGALDAIVLLLDSGGKIVDYSSPIELPRDFLCKNKLSSGTSLGTQYYYACTSLSGVHNGPEIVYFYNGSVLLSAIGKTNAYLWTLGAILICISILLTLLFCRSYMAKIKTLAHLMRVEEGEDLLESFDKLRKRTIFYNDQLAMKSSLEAIGSTTAMVAHDVRKPLAGMKALLAALPAVKDDPDQLAKMAAGVDRNIATTNALLNDILDFSRDSTALDLRDHDPQSIITAALGEVLRDRSDADVRIEYDLRHRSYLRVDDGRIVRVLTNIIANAVEAMEGRGRLWFRTEERGRADLGQGRMLLAVGNSGPVIPEDARARLFDPFFTQGKKGGTGLGLAICRRIIDLHGGSIEVASGRDESTGEPSTEFTLELLAAEGRLFVNEAELIHHSNEFATFHKEDALREEVGDTASTAEFLRLNKERDRPSYLLIVDDEPLFRETVRGLLETVPQVKDHVKVIEADSAETGLKIFEGREFDYVIADIDLGRTRMNGYEFAQRVLDQYPSAFVLIHSNKRREEMDRTIRQINSPRFMGFLPKPMKQSELLQFLACKTFEAPEVGDSEVPVRKKVLVVNDDEGLSLSFRIMLKSPGVQVLEAGSVSDALKWISGGGVDVILSDINLGEGEKDGYELLRTVREKDATIPFYLVSGYSRADEEPKAKERGANGYLQLPVDKEQLEVLMQ